MLAMGLFSTLLAIRTDIEAFSITVTGFIMSSYFVGLLLGALFSVKLVIRVGHIRAFGVYASIMSTAAIIHVIVIDPLVWAIVRAVCGFCMAGLILITEAWLNERATNKVRGQLLAVYMATGYGFSGLGQFILPLADPAGFKLFGFISIVFSLALVPVLLTRAPSPRAATRERISPLELYRISPVAAVGTFLAGMLNSAFYSMGPLFTRQIGLSLTATSAFMASVILGGLLLQMPIGRLSDRFDRRKVLIGNALVTALACIAVLVTVSNLAPSNASSGETGWSLYIAGALYGSLAFTMYSLCAAQANDLTPPDKLIQTAGGLLLAFGTGAIFGPLVGGLFMQLAGPQSLFVYFLILNLGIAGHTTLRLRARKSGQQKRAFVPKPGSLYADQTLFNAATKSKTNESSTTIVEPTVDSTIEDQKPKN